MKNNKTILIVVAVVVVVVIGAVVLMMHGMSSPQAAPGTPNSPSAGAPSGSSPISLNGLLAAGTSQQCAFSSQNPNSAQVTGTVYVTAGHLRGDFNSKNAAGTLTTSHIITDGTTAYVWTDSQPQGMEMSLASISSANASAHAGVDPNQPMNYSCTSWATDETEFTPPSDVTFQNMTSLGIPPGATATGTGMSATCAMCAQAGSAQAIAACKAALHC